MLSRARLLLSALPSAPVLEGTSSSSLPSTSTSTSLFQQPASWQQVAWLRALDPKALAKQASQAKKKKQKDQKAQGADEADPAAAAAAAAAAADSAGFHEDSLLDEKDATRIVIRAVENVIPHLDVRTISGHTKTTYVPGVMPPAKGRSLALRWLVKAAQNRRRGSRNSMAHCLALELLLAYQKQGSARQKRDELHKMALLNRANMHLRWW